MKVWPITDEDLRLIEDDPVYPLKAIKAQALAAEVRKLRAFAQLVHDWCEPIGTGTGGDGDALNMCSDLYQKAREVLEP